MAAEAREWQSRTTFLLAAIGSAVGLGNAWRFPGLAAKHGGGAFLLAYVLGMLAMGFPLLMLEIAIGRKTRHSAPMALGSIRRSFAPIGWAQTLNAFLIATYYTVVFAWVILMAVSSYRFAGMTGQPEQASGLWATLICTTFTTAGYGTIAWRVVGCLCVAWSLVYACIRNGVQSVGKVVKYTVLLPVLCLLLMAARGLTLPNALEGIRTFLRPEWSALSEGTLWVDAMGQVFYSLSVMMAVLYTYGSFLQAKSNVVADAVTIVCADFGVSLLAGIVLFTTVYGSGQTVDDVSTSGIATAFLWYPAAMVCLSGNGVVNACFAFLFYFCLCTLAIDSAFSLIEGVAAAFAERFHQGKKRMTRVVCLCAAVLSFWFVTGAGYAWLDVVDAWSNGFHLLAIGILESVALGWGTNGHWLTEIVNQNTKRLRIPHIWLCGSVRVVIPVALTALLVWNLTQFFKHGARYGAAAGYSLTSNLVGGWLMTALVCGGSIGLHWCDASAMRREKKEKNKKTLDKRGKVW